MPATETNATATGRSLEREFAWVASIIDARIRLYFGQECAYKDVRDITPPDLTDDGSSYGQLVRRHALSFEQRFILVLALAPRLRPQLLDPLRIKNANVDGYFAEFGGRHLDNRFHPTVRTASFLLAGDDVAQGLALTAACLAKETILYVAQLLRTGAEDGAEVDPLLLMHADWLSLLSTGDLSASGSPGGLPLHRLGTSLEWDDLVLGSGQLDELETIRAWIGHGDTLLREWDLGSRIQPGYRALFRGPSGTGKTLAAALLGKTTGLTVYRVDLAAVRSRYIGETQEHLARILELGESQRAILLFDEAESLFGRRSDVRDAHDRYVNIDIAWLLRQMEEFPGTVIVTTKLRDDLDETLARRFHSIVEFPNPGADERLRLWRQAFAGCALDPDIDLQSIAEEFDISGGAIANVLRRACLMAVRRDDGTVQLADLRRAAAAELQKRGEPA